MRHLEPESKGSSAKTFAIVAITILSMWLLAATIHRLAAIITYVVVFGVGYLLGRATD